MITFLNRRFIGFQSVQRVCRLFGTLSSLSQQHINLTVGLQKFLRPNFTTTVTLSVTKMSYSAVEKGSVNTQSYRVFFFDNDGKVVSPFHDIPLFSNPETKECNMVVEIPRWTNHKMEICKEEKMNPIKQDVKKGAVRYVKNCFPHHGYIWNYGALPQTWEDVDHTEPTTGTKGDNDPLDVCEIGQTVHKRGSVIQVKILGVMCLVDEGETDWKIICIDVKDPLANVLNDIHDVEKEMPGFIKATREWFTVYKIPDGKPANKFAFNGEAKDREFALKVVDETHQQWQKLVGGGDVTRGEIDCCCLPWTRPVQFCQNTKVAGSPYLIDQATAQAVVSAAPALGEPGPIPEDVDKWYYIQSSNL